MSGLKPVRSRFRVCAVRWLDVAAWAVLCAALAAIGLWWKPAILPWLGDVPTGIWIAAITLVFVYGARRGPRRLAAVLDARYALYYPPVWIGAFAGIAGTLMAVVKSEEFRTQLGVRSNAAAETLALALGIAALAPLVVSAVSELVALLFRFFRWCAVRLRTPEKDSDDADSTDEPADSLDISRLRQWLGNDDAVEEADQDMFEHARIARRLARRLAGARPPSQAVIGELGAGKTTLGHLLQTELERESPQVKLIRAELWPYESPRPAVKAVIAALIDGLASHVNVFGLRGLPSSYADVVAATGAIPGALARLKRPISDPIASLAEIDRMATGVGLHFVIWVEDLERFAIGDPTQTAPETQDEAERLAPVRSLLYGLDRLHSITVVTATTSLYRRFDMEKIARYVERIPSLKPEEVKRIVCTFRREWAGRDVIDPTSEIVRKEIGWEGDDNELLRAMIGDQPVTLADACIVLCRTPRILKQALRRCEEICDDLAGEIDYDATLAMSILREASPAGFAIVEQQINAIRYRSTRNRTQNSLDPIEELRTRLSEVGLQGRDHEAVMLIVEKTIVESKLAQGFSNQPHADYWHRFSAIPELRPDERDQAILHAVLDGDDAQLLDFISDNRSSIVERFAAKIAAERLIGLLLPLVKRNAEKSPKEWEEGTRPPGLIPLWRTFLERHRMGEFPEARLLDAVLRCYEFVVSKNLTVAAELEHWLVVPSGDTPQLLVGPSVDQAKKRLRDLVVEKYVGNPEPLALQFGDAQPYVLLWLCWGIDRVRAGDLDSPPFDEWPSFAKTLLQAAETNAAAMLPQIAAIVTRENREFRGPRTWEFLGDRCRTLFGDVSVVLGHFVNPPEGISELPMIQAMKRAADAAEHESGLAKRITSRMEAARGEALREAATLLAAGAPVTDSVPEALSALALDHDRKTQERQLAIATLRGAGFGGRVANSILEQWFDEEVDEVLGAAFASLFHGDPELLDDLCKRLGGVGIPEDDASNLVRLIGQALAAIRDQLASHPTEVGTDRAERCANTASRFAACAPLAPIVREIENLAPEPEQAEQGTEDDEG